MATNTPTKPGAQPRYQVVSHPTSENYAARRKKAKGQSCKINKRVVELNRYFDHRYGDSIIPGVIDDVEAMLHVLAMVKNPEQRIETWLAARAPWFKDDALVARIMRKPIWFGADAVAKKIGLTDAIRTRLNVVTIGSTDVTKKMREARREANKVEAKRKKRRAEGRQTRKEYEALSTERQKPWITLGVSRATWFRKYRVTPPERSVSCRETVETSAGAVILYTSGATPVSNLNGRGQTCAKPERTRPILVSIYGSL